MYNIATPLPCTKLFEQTVKAGLVESDYWKRFILDENYPGYLICLKMQKNGFTWAYKEFFFSPQVLMNKLLEIRPNNILAYAKAAKGILGLKK